MQPDPKSGRRLERVGWVLYALAVLLMTIAAIMLLRDLREPAPARIEGAP